MNMAPVVDKFGINLTSVEEYARARWGCSDGMKRLSRMR